MRAYIHQLLTVIWQKPLTEIGSLWVTNLLWLIKWLVTSATDCFSTIAWLNTHPINRCVYYYFIVHNCWVMTNSSHTYCYCLDSAGHCTNKWERNVLCNNFATLWVHIGQQVSMYEPFCPYIPIKWQTSPVLIPVIEKN